MDFLTQLQVRTGWKAPKSVLARLGLLLAAITVPLYLLGRIFPALNSGGWFPPTLSFLLWFLSVVLLLLLYRWLRRNLMWRLRNRLVVTYIFIGVIPILLLLAMGAITGYLFAGQFATYVVTEDISAELQRLEAGNALLATEVSARAEDTRFTADDVMKAAHEHLRAEFPGRETTVWIGKTALVPVGPKANPLEIPEYALKSSWFRSLVLGDDNRIYLRAVNTQATRRGVPVSVITSVPMSPELLTQMVKGSCLVTVQPPDLDREPSAPAGKESQERPPRRGNGVQFRFGGQKDSSVVTVQGVGESARVSAGTVPVKTSMFDKELTFGTALQLRIWRTGESKPGLLVVQTRPSALYQRLFRTLGDFSGIILSVLVAVAILFALIELVALFIGVRLTRTMTASVANLYDATQHIETGQLSHRIQVTREDQMAALERSFNSMTESLQKLIAEQKEKQRIESELAIAQEVQALLFPRDISSLEGFEVHGICRPARTVSGDYYDFLPVGPHQLGLAVGDISGKGISAALLMATVHAFVRAYTLVESVPALQAVGAGNGDGGNALIRMSAPGSSTDLPPGTLLAMLNHQLYRSTPSEKYATMFLGFYDTDTRQLKYSNAGHLPPLIIGQDGSVRQLETGGLVVGLFGDVTYNDDSVEMHPGDILVAYSDGITEPENEFGEFGEERLIALVHENRHLPLDRISDVVVSAVTDWIGGNEQPDDVTLVLARAQ
ncbi:MAG TPA: SpoIIE family protein phosphatase [Terriglobales bacterium]|nr:SpoIIE family protein phosphatase [Terriglobales bacterium]